MIDTRLSDLVFISNTNYIGLRSITQICRKQMTRFHFHSQPLHTSVQGSKPRKASMHHHKETWIQMQICLFDSFFSSIVLGRKNTISQKQCLSITDISISQGTKKKKATSSTQEITNYLNNHIKVRRNIISDFVNQRHPLLRVIILVNPQILLPFG